MNLISQTQLAILLEGQADVDLIDQDGYNALMYAAKMGGYDTVSYLMNHAELDMNAKDSSGKNALHFAAAFGGSDTVQALLECKMNVDAMTDDGMAPLMFAARRKDGEDATVILTAFGAELDMLDNRNR